MTAIAERAHRVVAATAHIHAELDAVADASVWSMGSAETAHTLTELGRAKAKIVELEARVAAHADDLRVGDDVAASSTAAWLAHETKTTRPAAHGVVKLGHDLDAHPEIREALRWGDVCEDQARVIIRAVDALPDDVTADLRVQAEAHLVAEAEHHDAKALARLGKRLFEIIAPDHADAYEARLLERDEAAAARTCHLKVWDDGHGTTHLRGTLPTLEGAALKKLLTAFASRKHRAQVEGAGTELLPTPEAMGRAFCELVTHYPPKALAKTGGLNATLIVTMTYESLVGDLEQAALLDTGDRISPALARKLACEAGIRPAVLGTDSEVLDLGRKARFHTEPMRIAMFLRDRGCAEETCDRTTGLHAHHATTRWSDGGNTNVNDGVLLCPWHHARAHDTRYTTAHTPAGEVQFHRRT